MAGKSPISPVWGQILWQFSVCFQVFHFIPIQFPRSQFPVGCGDFLIFPTVFSLFSGFPFYTYYNKEDFNYEHHYRHRPRLLRHQNSA